MEDLLDDLIIGTRVKEIFEGFYQESFSVKTNLFSLLLSQISEEFGVELENIDYYFESETNLLDENDLLNPE